MAEEFDLILCMDEMTKMLNAKGLLMASLVSNTAKLEILSLREALSSANSKLEDLGQQPVRLH
jgi:hypothetical protein